MLILADDMNKDSAGVYGNTDVETPNIDRLAKEGMLFNNAYTSTAMCTPTRVQLFTGLYPFSSGSWANHGYVEKGTQSIGQYLGGLGYRVGIHGKRHVGPGDSFPFEGIGDNRGADYMRQPTNWISRGGPWCMIFASNVPHLPWSSGNYKKVHDPATFNVLPYLYDTPQQRKSMQAYYAEVAELDDQVGEVDKLLKRENMESNTLMIFTTEQGAALPGCKWELWECGINVGFIARWPGVIRPGAVSNAMVHYVDVVPTLIDVAGGDLDRYALSGTSFAKVLQGASDTHNRFTYGVHSDKRRLENGYNIRSVREGNWKFIMWINYQKLTGHATAGGDDYNSWLSASRVNRTGQAAKLIRRHRCRPPEALYDLTEDPYELNNLARNPTAAAKETINTLKTELNRWMVSQGDNVVSIVGDHYSGTRCINYFDNSGKDVWSEY